MLGVLPNMHFKGRKFSKDCKKGKLWNCCTSGHKVMGKLSHGASEKISALDAPLGHPDQGRKTPSSQKIPLV